MTSNKINKLRYDAKIDESVTLLACLNIFFRYKVLLQGLSDYRLSSICSWSRVGPIGIICHNTKKKQEVVRIYFLYTLVCSY